MQPNGVNNREHYSFTCTWSIHIYLLHMPRIPWALGEWAVHCGARRLKERWSPWGWGTGHLKSVPHFPIIYQCGGSFSSPSVWDFVTVLQRFPGHGKGPHLGAGVQKWKLLDVLGCKPPLATQLVAVRTGLFFKQTNKQRFKTKAYKIRILSFVQRSYCHLRLF